MKIISIIGTRPQYIKVKPFYDFCKINKIDHKIIDTQQHYSHNVSQAIIDDLNLHIDLRVDGNNENEIAFIANTMINLQSTLREEKPDFVLVYGDTNSTFCASVVCYKMKVPFAHVEARLRCGDIEVPEEVNRIFADTVSQVRFCSVKDLAQDAADIWCGDLEYELLNVIDPVIKNENYGVMTIHRQANIDPQRMQEILDFCQRVGKEIRFFVHHRTIKALGQTKIPENVKIFDSCPYTEMVNSLAACSFIITDSGGINKTAPFFGKRAIVMRKQIEWVETEEAGFVKRGSLSDRDVDWILQPAPKREKRFYLSFKDPSEIIYNSIKRIMESYR